MAYFANAEAPDAWRERKGQFEQHPGLETLTAAWGRTSWDLQGEKKDRGSWDPQPVHPRNSLNIHPLLPCLCSAIVIDEL